MTNYLTQQDEREYGRDLIDFSMRAATQAVAPHLQELERRNAALEQQLAREQRHTLDSQVTATIPNWPEINRDPRWHQWLMGVDSLNGRSRQQLLNDAIASGSAERCAAFFQSFMRAQGGSRAAPAHGSPKPAPGGSADKPVYTPQQIKQIYEMKRKGAWNGKEAEFARLEQDIFEAQKERRMLAPVYLTK